MSVYYIDSVVQSGIKPRLRLVKLDGWGGSTPRDQPAPKKPQVPSGIPLGERDWQEERQQDRDRRPLPHRKFSGPVAPCPALN